MMPSWFQILIVVVLIVLLFGRGKISEFMGDVAKGIKSFKKGMAEDETDDEHGQSAHKTIDHNNADRVDPERASAGETTHKAG